MTQLELKMWAELSERFSHEARSKLAIPLGVIDDLMVGLPVGEEDLRDSKQALQSVIQILNSIRDFPKQWDDRKLNN